MKMFEKGLNTVVKMKYNRLAIVLIIVIVVGLFITLALDFAALHDINNEYISKNILRTLDVQLTKEVPVWTENKGEWDYLSMSFIIKAVAYVVLLTVAICFYKNYGKFKNSD
jgi:hypothetical protein